MSWVRFVMVGLAMVVAVLPLPACRHESEQDAGGAEIRSESEDSLSGVRLALSVDRTEIQTVDRLRVMLEIVRPAGMGIGWSEPDWEAAGWERVDRVDTPQRVLPDGLIQERAVVTLEPFLDGEYQVPGLSVPIGERLVSTAPIGVLVTSVLDASETNPELAEASPAAMMDTESGPGTGLVVAAVAVALGALLIVWRLTGARREEATESTPEPVEALRMAADGRLDGQDALTHVHRAIDRLDSEQSGLLRPLAARCERARFSPGGGEDAGMIAREALGLLNAAETGGVS